MDPGRPVTIGVPLPTYSVVVLDPDADRAVPPGAMGEIGIAGIGLASGYLNRPELTERAFVPDFLGIPENPSGRIYRTGDLGRVNTDGEIEHHGRIDTQVKIRGYGVNPAFVTGTAALRTYWRDNELERATLAKGQRIATALTALAQSVPGTLIRPRGRGLAHGLAFENGELAGKVSSAAFERGLLVETCGPQGTVIKLLPPLTITGTDLDQGLALLTDATQAIC